MNQKTGRVKISDILKTLSRGNSFMRNVAIANTSISLTTPSVATAIPLVVGDQVSLSPFSPENYLVPFASGLLLDILGMTCL